MLISIKSSTCLKKKYAKMTDNHFNRIIYKNCFFILEHTVSYDIPGDLILFFNQHVPLVDQGMESLSKLGPLLTLSIQSIQEVIKPQKVYCLLFGEKHGNPHFSPLSKN